MTNLLQFPLRQSGLSVLLSSGAPFYVDVRVTDAEDPDTTHWELLRWNFRAAGRRANKGFTQPVARRRAWHSFKIKRRDKAVRYLKETYRLRSAGLIEMKIDDVRVATSVGRPAAAA
jgi:hypothetical protein